MKKIAIYCSLLLFLLPLNCAKEPQPQRINAIERFWVIPGSGMVYIQWRLNTDVWFVEEPEFLGYEIYRADSSSGIFREIQRLTYEDRQYWGVLDSTVQDSVYYAYYIEVTFFMECEIPCPYDISDTVSVFPYPDAQDPIPDAPESLSIVAAGDSFSISWVPPNGCDSLYYLLVSEDGQTYSNTGDYWYPNWFEPIWLSIPQYQIYNLRDEEMRYYKVVALVNRILSYASMSDSIRHE